MLYLRFKRKELKIRSYLCRLPSAVDVMLNLSIINGIPLGKHVYHRNLQKLVAPLINTGGALLTEREGRTGEYWPEVVAVRTERSKVRTKTTEGQYSPARLELARLVSSLLYGTRTILVLSLPAFENKKYTAYDRFHGNGPYGKIPTKKEPIRKLGFTLPYNKCK